MSADLSKATPTPNGIAERVAGWLENRAEIYESQITDDGVPSRMCRIFTNELHNLARSFRLIPADDPAHDDRAELIAALEMAAGRFDDLARVIRSGCNYNNAAFCEMSAKRCRAAFAKASPTPDEDTLTGTPRIEDWK